MAIMDFIIGISVAIALIILFTSPLWIQFIILERRKKSVKIGNIYIKYYDRKNPFHTRCEIFKVIDKKDGYIQYEEFKSTHDALNNVPWYDYGERKISDMSLRYMTNWWQDFECWKDIDE